MQIVADSGSEPYLAAEQRDGLNIHIVPLTITLGGISYREGLDIDAATFYQLLATSEQMPTTSQPSAGEFAALYRRLAITDPDILSIHISSGLSGTVGSAQAGAALVPEANVTVVDTKTLSAPAGWQVEVAARAAKAGWAKERILALVRRVSSATDCLYTLKELRYLIHGGRISHMKGLIASLLNIKPIIGVEKVNGTYVQLGQTRSFPHAVRELVDLVAKQHTPGSALRVQVMHAENAEGAMLLHEQMAQRFDCTWLPMGRIALALGAHTGPTMVGMAVAPQAIFAELP